VIKFQQLWDSYPTIQGDKTPCTTNGKTNFDDQCAIRLGSALAKNGVKTTNLVPKGRHCWQHDISEGHVLAAEELANGLARFHIGGIQKKIEINPSTFQKDLIGKKGIIFFKDFWTRNGESFRNRSGDHIDLWNGSPLTDWRTWFLMSATFNTGGTYSRSKEIWFWRVL
jgi:hypothetical protein